MTRSPLLAAEGRRQRREHPGPAQSSAVRAMAIIGGGIAKVTEEFQQWPAPTVTVSLEKPRSPRRPPLGSSAPMPPSAGWVRVAWLGFPPGLLQVSSKVATS